MNYYLHILILVEIYCILVLSLNFQLGFSKLMNLAIAIFYGLGAYSYAIVSINFNIPFIPTLLIAVFINVIFSIFIALASSKYKEEIFVLVSLAFQTIIFSIILNWDSLTGGANGILNIPKPIIAGYEVAKPIEFAALGIFILFLVAFVSYFLHRSVFGRTLMAIRDNEISAQTIGKNIIFFKSFNIAISCGIASISGVIFASYMGFIDTTSFGVNESIDILFILILGGILSTKGAIVGTILFFVIQELLKYIGLNDEIAFNLRIIIFSIAVIIILYAKPFGLFGKYNIEE